MKKLKDKKGIALMPLVIIIAVLLIGAGIVLFTLIFNSNEKGKSNTLDSATSGDIGESSKSSLKVGDYVEYDVSYTDMYTGYEFEEKNGWRVLDPGEENPDGTYSGVKLISTGVPANLYYSYSTIKNYERDGSIGNWAGDDTQRESYLELFKPANRVESDYNVYAAAGLYSNFGLIKFTLGENPSANVGGYKTINGKTSEYVTGEEFKVGEKAEEVHNLTLKELNEARGESETSTTSTSSKDGATGLFYLRGLNEFGYSSSISSGSYWLASPHTSAGSPDYLRCVNDDGYILNGRGSTHGVRPVVSLKSKIQIEEIER